MALNEIVLKNMANEITKNCHTANVSVEPEFVIYFAKLLLLNPKYGKPFRNRINRSDLVCFVNECVTLLTSGGIFLVTLRVQYIMKMEYDDTKNLIQKNLDNIETCLKPLLNEIVDSFPDNDDDRKKLFRKISIYIILASGLGNPALLTTLKEGLAALESVFSPEDLKAFPHLPRAHKVQQLTELMEIVSGVRLFNRDCKKGGDGIPDLPFNLTDASRACLSTISNTLVTTMEKVDTLTSAIEDSITICEETGNINVLPQNELNASDYKRIFDYLAHWRQYELVTRKLLGNVENVVQNAIYYTDEIKRALCELHDAVKFKVAVPVVVVFPLFTKLWRVWRDTQNEMYVVSTMNRLVGLFENLKPQAAMPQELIEKAIKGRAIKNDAQRMSAISLQDRMSLVQLINFVPSAPKSSDISLKENKIKYLGFCALCLVRGALVPANPRVGLFKLGAELYGFCSVPMAIRFHRDPHRYINEVINYARNNPHYINLLGIRGEVEEKCDIDELVVTYLPKIKAADQEVQTETHPITSYVEKNYSWDLWQHKRRACQMASIVNSRTRSTQTHYSHMRSEIQCQTVEARDKCLQTKRDSSTNVPTLSTFMWGLRGQLSCPQHVIDLTEQIREKSNKRL